MLEEAWQAVLTDAMIITVLSFSIDWPWREGVSMAPRWVDGWLGLLGFVFAGAAASAGYYLSAFWSRLARPGAG